MCIVSLTVTIFLFKYVSSSTDQHTRAGTNPSEDWKTPKGKDPKDAKASKDGLKTDNLKHPDSLIISKLVAGHDTFKKRGIAESKPELKGPLVLNRKYSREPTLFPPKDNQSEQVTPDVNDDNSQDKKDEDSLIQSLLKDMNIDNEDDSVVIPTATSTSTSTEKTPAKPATLFPTRRPYTQQPHPVLLFEPNKPAAPAPAPRGPEKKTDTVTISAREKENRIFQGSVVRASMRDVDRFLFENAAIYNFSLVVTSEMLSQRQVVSAHVLVAATHTGNYQVRRKTAVLI